MRPAADFESKREGGSSKAPLARAEHLSIKGGIKRVDGKQKWVVKRLAWADEVGRALKEERSCAKEVNAKSGDGALVPRKTKCKADMELAPAASKGGQSGLGISSATSGPIFKPLEGAVPGEHEVGKSGGGAFKGGELGIICREPRPGYVGPLSYKEALLRGGLPVPPVSARRGAYLSVRRPPTCQGTKGRCFRCLAGDHRVASCRNPVRCFLCWGVGHRASRCKSTFRCRQATGGVAMNGDRRPRGRVARVTAHLPYTEEFFRRVELRRNAILVDVIQPAELGPAPQQSLANALARRFGGYGHDFFVSRYSERDFAIILPSWVSAEVLVRRQILSLDEVWLRCFTWGAYRNARPHRTLFTAWIQLRNVPFECWTPARIASLVSGFGRFI